MLKAAYHKKPTPPPSSPFLQKLPERQPRVLPTRTISVLPIFPLLPIFVTTDTGTFCITRAFYQHMCGRNPEYSPPNPDRPGEGRQDKKKFEEKKDMR